MVGARLYIGRLTPDVRESDLEELFKGYGKIIDLRLMGNFGFVEWGRPEDAEDVMKDFDGKPFMGDTLKIEFAKESRKNQAARGGGGGGGGYGPPPPGYGGGGYGGGGYGGGYGGYYDYYGGGPGGYGGGGYGPPPGGRGGYGPPPGYGPPGGGPPRGREPNVRRGQFRLIVTNLPPNTSWQDLKDLGREHGRILFADVDASRPDEGVIEYDNREDFDRALDRIEGVDLRGNKLRVDPADRSMVRGGGYGGSAAGGDSAPPLDDRPPPPVRDRSRSPAPRHRGDDDREPPPARRFDSRSPPPRRERDYD